MPPYNREQQTDPRRWSYAMNSKQLLTIMAVILVALCGYFFISIPSTRITEAKSRAPQAASTITGTSRTELRDTSITAKTSPAVPLALMVTKLTLPLAFTDTATNPELKQAVARDLQLIYGHLDDHELVQSIGNFAPLIIGGREIAPIKLLNFTGNGRFTPAKITQEIGYIGIVDGHESLLINDKVIAAYHEAMERRGALPAAYTEIDHFIDALNLMKRGDPISDANQMFVVDPAVAAQFNSIGPSAFALQFEGRRYRGPSLLEFSDGSEVGELYKGKPVSKIYVVTKDGIEDGMPPIIFDQGRWKFLILSPPT
jgi:hypothetical protein